MKKFDWLEKLKDKLNFRLNKAKGHSIDDLEAEDVFSDLDESSIQKTNFNQASRRSLTESLQGEAVFNIQKINRNIQKPAIENYLPYVLGSLLGVMTADLSLTAIRPSLLPESIPSLQKQTKISAENTKILSDYDTITRRNAFNSDGLIPPPLNAKQENQQNRDDGPASLSKLPLKLLGTIVHVNPGKSVASIEAKAGQSSVLPYIPNDDIQGLAKLIKVERQKAFFRNLSNNRMEYIEMKIEGDLTFGRPPAGGEEVSTGILKDGNNFTVSKTELTKQLANLPQLLQQARAMPYNDPYTGAMMGFKVVDIKPGSIFEKLINPGDIIKEVNGTKVDSAAKAMTLYRTMKDSSAIKITVERNGRDEQLDFNVQ